MVEGVIFCFVFLYIYIFSFYVCVGKTMVEGEGGKLFSIKCKENVTLVLFFLFSVKRDIFIMKDE